MLVGFVQFNVKKITSPNLAIYEYYTYSKSQITKEKVFCFLEPNVTGIEPNMQYSRLSRLSNLKT